MANKGDAAWLKSPKRDTNTQKKSPPRNKKSPKTEYENAKSNPQAHLGARLEMEGGALMANKFDAAWLTGPGTAARFEGVMVSKPLEPSWEILYEGRSLNLVLFVLDVPYSTYGMAKSLARQLCWRWTRATRRGSLGRERLRASRVSW